MKDLNLPFFKGEDIFNKKILSMDEYLEFVKFNLKHTVDVKAARKWKNELAVNVPFSLK